MTKLRLPLLFSLLLACGPAMHAQAAQSDLAINNAWIRFIIASRPAAGYFTLTNSGARPHELVGASSPDCKSVMLHQSVNVNGVESMHMIPSVTVPAHGSVEFAPGGYHLMCMAPAPDMKVGGTASVTLDFKDGTTLSAAFEVRGATGD